MKRKIESEQYYTNKELAKLCINKIKQYYILDDFDLILEPSAGDGSFYDLLPKEKTVGIDIEPKHENIQKLDFFTYVPPQNKKIITIGNPPFGARGSLAMKFLDGVCKFSDVVAFILPRSFKKYTFKDRINPYFHLIEEFDCDSFNTPDGEVLSVKCVFQIWERRNFKRDIIVLDNNNEDFIMKHYHFSKTSKEEMDIAKEYYDFAVAQVGSNFKPKNTKDINSGSYWFIKSNSNKNLVEIFKQLDYSFLDGMNTVFKSLSKKDIILAYKNKINEL